MRKMRLVGLSGSIRKDSYNTAILRTLKELLPQDVDLDLHPLDDLPLYNSDLESAELPPSVSAFKAAVQAADGLVLSSPEYNGGTSGVLKNALDWASRPGNAAPLRGKCVLIISCSPAFTGGARAHAQLRDTLASTLSRVIVHPPVVIAGVHEKIRDRRLIDESNLQFALGAMGALVEEIRGLSRVNC